jgi:tRNA pseudouridine32 synthase/23S rRNA pseudouridine746 synthase
MRDHLVARLPRVASARIVATLRDELIVGRPGPVAGAAPSVPGEYVWFHRDQRVEVQVPFALPLLHRDDDAIVVDKPHVLATIPRGRRL